MSAISENLKRARERVARAAARAGQLPVTIKKIDASAKTVTVDTTGADTLDNEDEQDLNAEGDAIICMSDGNNYWVG